MGNWVCYHDFEKIQRNTSTTQFWLIENAFTLNCMNKQHIVK